MSGTEATLYEIRNGAAWITLNRPENRNALSAILVTELFDHITASNANDDVRCIVITGNGPAFCAGADLKSPPGQLSEGSDRAVPYHDVLTAILESPKPVIAAVNGAAFAGGLGLVGASDIVVTRTDIQMSFSEVRIGVIPAIISVVCMPKLGTHHGMKLFLTGERFDGQQAVDMGLAHISVPEGQLISAVEEQIAMINLGGPIAVQECKNWSVAYRNFLLKKDSKKPLSGAHECSVPRKEPRGWLRSGKSANPTGSKTSESLRVRARRGKHMTDIIRIGNCSGFYGDRLDAAREMVEGGPIDVLTGDYLAELTMSILYSQKQSRGEDTGYVGTFLKQVRDIAGLCAEKNIKIVSNAGGLNPKSMAAEIENILSELGSDLKVAYIDGDNLLDDLDALQADGEAFTNLDTQENLANSDQKALTANAYLGGWGIKEALDQGADIVICPRVTDAAVVIGPAAWKFNWQRDDYDALAGALAAGHIIECGAQCCGGNYAFFEEVPSFRNVGYPIAEIEADGSFTITKHPGTGGLISEGTVKAQLLYEISTPAYYNPDVIAHFDTMTIEQAGDDRVYVSGCRGSSPRQPTRFASTPRGPTNNPWKFC